MKQKLAELLEGLEDHSEICPVSPWAKMAFGWALRHDDEALPDAMSSQTKGVRGSKTTPQRRVRSSRKTARERQSAVERCWKRR